MYCEINIKPARKMGDGYIIAARTIYENNELKREQLLVLKAK